MKLVTFLKDDLQRAGLYHQDQALDLAQTGKLLGIEMPAGMLDIIRSHELLGDTLRRWNEDLIQGRAPQEAITQSPVLLAPIPNPVSCRDGYAFRQHVATARRNRNVPMIPEFDQYPIFYFTNHLAIQGPGEIRCMADHFRKLDFELEAAIVTGKSGRNIRAEQADDHIFGYMIMNDMSARVLQMEEMLLNLGPAKGKDFSTVIGPWIVTRDELQQYRCTTVSGHTGEQFNLGMRAFHNGKQISSGNLNQMDWTFAEILERVAYGVDVVPGEVIGSGTVGTGCYLELNGSWKLENPQHQEVWLQEGDEIILEIDALGTLRNTIVKESDFSILARKKMAPAAN